MSHTFEIYRDKAGEYRARFKYNREVIWSSEGYSSKASVIDLINSIKRDGPSALVEDSDDVISKLRSATVPAADRIVRLDHNSKEFREFEAAYRNLIAKITSGNDLGSFSVEEVDIARAEVKQLGIMKDQERTRAAQLWEFAKGTLLWIAEKSAGAAIGKIAVGLLIALAALLGVTIT